MSIYCLFHGDLDGAVAASQFYGKYGKDAQYYPVNYGEKFPLEHVDLTKEDTVYIVDFSYDAEKKDAYEMVDPQKVEKMVKVLTL